jgi:hypothetical protein
MTNGPSHVVLVTGCMKPRIELTLMIWPKPRFSEGTTVLNRRADRGTVQQ